MPKQTKTYIKILEAALPLFAAFGYKGVAMRDIANTVGITAAALYNHFPNKEALYFKALEYAFDAQVAGLAETLAQTQTPRQRLTAFIGFWVETFGSDVILRALLQREMTDADETRLRLLAQHVFQPVYVEIEGFIQSLSARHDSLMLFTSIAGLVMYHFETAPMRKLLPGYHPDQDEHATIIEHVVSLLAQGLNIS
ncbi:MAG: TetR/AcrR family transcriptional regulator [Magnetococcales bacterium]|nr:TetR/AcrR family transcriptional regulator [Magnetococcales bacterium]MBF0150672.1 TetR/AcrR family transcriptional regulator [Magnetococcales bacterium]MBF0173436.1 TetR/AcrR family transcriptional regulator [Magnetococcales bacterium]MBF0631635.1 TetR/AcrR family transcriptional regulator [Magnetococcales bacterium]